MITICIDGKTFKVENAHSVCLLKEFLRKNHIYECTRCDRFEKDKDLLVDTSDFLVCRTCMEKQNVDRS